MWAKQIKRVFPLLVMGIGSMMLAGCGSYWQGGYWRGGVVVQQPGPYAYEYYYDPGLQAYYCYYPSYGWRYCPSPPPPGAVFWRGPAPMYLPQPAPAIGFNYYFDPDRHVYYYRGPDNHWRYYPGHPPQQARFWHGGRPGGLPHPPRGAPERRGPGGDRGRRGHDRH